MQVAAGLTLLTAWCRDLSGSDHSDTLPSEAPVASLSRRRLFRENVAASNPTLAMRRLVIPRACAVTSDEYIKHLRLCAVGVLTARLPHYICGGGSYRFYCRYLVLSRQSNLQSPGLAYPVSLFTCDRICLCSVAIIRDVLCRRTR
jgi:hypothetical protein